MFIFWKLGSACRVCRAPDAWDGKGMRASCRVCRLLSVVEVKYPPCSSHSDCGSKQFCGTECWTGGCGSQARAPSGTWGRFCQPCKKCVHHRDSVTNGCDVCRAQGCMHVSIYFHLFVYMHVCMYAYMYTCMYVCMYACMYAYMHIYMYVCMYVCIYACVYVCMYVCSFVC